MLNLTLSLEESKTKDLNVNLIKSYINYFTPTERDISYQPNPEELKQLCLRRQCSVLMCRWNPLHDYFERFQRDGRFKKKSVRYIHKLLLKAVNRHSSHAIYKDEEINQIRQQEWRLQKKENLLFLSLWQYDAKVAAEDNIDEDMDNTVVVTGATPRRHTMQTTINRIPIGTTEIFISANKTPRKTPRRSLRQSSGKNTSVHIVGSEGEEDGMYDGDLEGNDDNSQDSVQIVSTTSPQAVRPVSQTVERKDSLEMVLMHTYVDSKHNSSLVSNTIDLVTNDNDLENELMPTPELDNRIVNGFLNLNTESMPLSSESMQHCSVDSVASFDSMVPLYENFSQFPLTSTQSQIQSQSLLQQPTGSKESQKQVP